MATLPQCLRCNRQHSGWDYCPGCYITDLEEALRPFVGGLDCKMLGCQTEKNIAEFCPNGCIIRHAKKLLEGKEEPNGKQQQA